MQDVTLSWWGRAEGFDCLARMQLPTWEPRLTGKIPANDYKTDTAITL